MNDYSTKKVGIGFVTGRKSFQKILKTYVYNWMESGVTDISSVKLCLFVAYDLKYSGTQKSDYTNIRDDVRALLDEVCFIGNTSISREIDAMINAGVLTEKEAYFLFRSGYAGKRNAVLYYAVKNGIDSLLFLDDDEYPVSVVENDFFLMWEGQQVLHTHLKYIDDADITNGHHCGYISPIPYIEFNDRLSENDFKIFISAISNDIIKWETVQQVMQNGGVTYANPEINNSAAAFEVKEENHCKFISGANLCINLKNPSRTYAFYNPPEARGEDTFLSTCLHDRKVLRVPCYAFHDGFSQYNHLMNGVLPQTLKYIKADSEKIAKRFYRACIGWIRYKPLLLYITQPAEYYYKIREIKEALLLTVPKLCEYFDRKEFMNIINEFDKYSRNVKNHYENYLKIQDVWKRVIAYASNSQY